MKHIIGIDVGKSGGIAVILGTEIKTYKMPETEKDMYILFHQFVGTDCHAFIEKVHSMPQNGVKASFTFGMNYGQLRMALISCGIPFEEVLPQKWMKHYGIKKGKNETSTQWKNRLKGMAQQRFPSVKMTLALSDACLIANYGSRTLSNT